jgi:hypothetical protein
MDTSYTDSVVVFGMLQPDGTLRLDESPGVPPGRMEVTLRPVSRQKVRLPDPPLEDLCIAPPCELPRLGVTSLVHPVPIFERLPDPIFMDVSKRVSAV